MAAGGIARDDSTVAFYGRIAALIRPEHVVLDLGAGRGAQLDGPTDYRRALARIRGRVRRLAGCDLDPIVLENSHLDDAAVLDDSGRLPYDDETFDLIFSDWVLEHLDDPPTFVAETSRVLKPGGWFCARTPNKWGYIALGSRLVPERLESAVLRRVQPDRQERDVFPKCYKLNSLRDIARAFPARHWENASFSMNSTPAYHGGNPLLFTAIDVFQTLTPPAMNTVLLAFLRKRPT